MKINLIKLVELCETSAQAGEVFELPGLRVEIISKTVDRVEISVTNGSNPPHFWWKPLNGKEAV